MARIKIADRIAAIVKQQGKQRMEVTHLTPAPIWRRLAAMLYDSFLVLALMFLAGFINLVIQAQIYGSEQLKTMTEQGYNIGGPVFYGVLLVTVYGFFGFFWTRSGQTLGMQAWRIQIIRQSSNNDKQLITPTQSVVRFLVAIPALLLAGLGLFWAFIDPEKRSWQDMASLSRVILLQKAVKKSG